MNRLINIDGVEFEIAANGATPIRFKQIFNKDLFKALQEGGDSPEAIETVTELCFVMKAQAEKANFNTIKYDDFVTWLENFGPMAFVENAEAVLTAYMENQETGSTAKKK